MEDLKDLQRNSNSLPPIERLGCPFNLRDILYKGYIVIIRL